jgi:hypothetical protein
LRDKIRARIDTGGLPLERPLKVYAGHGTSETCDGCGETIYPTQVEHELTYPDGRAYHLHFGCAALWDAELRRRGGGEE